MPSQNHTLEMKINKPSLISYIWKERQKQNPEARENFLSSTSVFEWKRGVAEVWLDDAEVGEELLGQLVADGWVNDNIITWYPVDWGGDAVLVTSLQRVDNPQDLSSVPSSGGWVGHNEADGLFAVDDEDGSDGESDSLRVDVGGVLVVQHVIEVGNLPVLVTNDWEGQVGTGNLVDVLDPATVGVDGVGRKTNELDATLCELRLEQSKSSELGGADGSVVLWVREENNPVVINEVVEPDLSNGGLSLEVWSNASKTERGRAFFGGHCIDLWV